MVQFEIAMFSHGPRLSGSSVSMPDFSVMQSSPTSMWQSEIRTSRHESGLMPSVFGESGGLKIVTFLTATFSQRTGLMVQAGEFVAVMPSMRTFDASGNEMSRGRGCATAFCWCLAHQGA